jgi:hypothetical protein
MKISLEEFVAACQKFYPELKVSYKSQSTLMKILSWLMFFNPKFMTNYTTTIGSTIYFPTEVEGQFEVNDAFTILHEMVHMRDESKYTKFFFALLYLFPQILAPFMLLFLLLSWKIAIPLLVLFLLPSPAYFRKEFELRGYQASLYCLDRYADNNGWKADLFDEAAKMNSYFKNSGYYFMWPFGVEQGMLEAITKIHKGQRPYEDEIFDQLDELVDKLK